MNATKTPTRDLGAAGGETLARLPLLLCNDGANWSGTFGVLVAALVDDLLALADGGPFEAWVEVSDDWVPRTNTVLHGVIVERIGTTLVFDDGFSVPVEALRAIGV